MANTTAEKTPISLANLARNNDKMKEYIQDEIDKISVAGVVVDDALSNTSENPVQNKVIKEALDEKVNSSDISMVATTGSYNDLTDKPTSMTPTAHTHAQSDITGLSTALSNKSDKNHKHTKSEITDFPTSLPASDVKAWAKADEKPTYTADEVGADASGSANTALTNAKAYTDTKIADLINGAPSTLDTLGEIAEAMENNQSVVEALDTAIGTKANESDLTSHTTDSVKHITSTERTNWNAAKTHADSAHAPSNAQANVIETVKVNGTALTPSSKAVNITVPSVGNGTITITQNGTTKGTFTTNQSGNTTIALTDNNTTYGVATTSANGLLSSSDKSKLDATNIAYGTCDTAAATAEKTITVSGNSNWKLTAGSIIMIKFTNTNTAQNPTFNINGTGGKSVFFNGVQVTTGSTGAGLTRAGASGIYLIYMYDGTQYVWIGQSRVENTTYTNASLGQGYGTCATEESTVAKAVTLSSYSLVTGGIVVVKFTYAVPASATMNINSKGAKAIYYKGSAITSGIIKAGDTATFIYNGTQYHLLTVDRDNNTTYGVATSSALGLVKSGTDITVDSSGNVSVNDDSHNHIISNIDGLQDELDSKLDVSGGTMTGALVAQSNTSYTTAQVRNATMSTSEPSGGSNGQIHYKYS